MVEAGLNHSKLEHIFDSTLYAIFHRHVGILNNRLLKSLVIGGICYCDVRYSDNLYKLFSFQLQNPESISVWACLRMLDKSVVHPLPHSLWKSESWVRSCT